MLISKSAELVFMGAAVITFLSIALMCLVFTWKMLRGEF